MHRFDVVSVLGSGPLLRLVLVGKGVGRLIGRSGTPLRSWAAPNRILEVEIEPHETSRDFKAGGSPNLMRCRQKVLKPKSRTLIPNPQPSDT